MTLKLEHPEISRLTDELVIYTGESADEAIIAALQERLQREKRRRHQPLAQDLLRIGQECAALPLIDGRSPDEIIEYNSVGLPV